MKRKALLLSSVLVALALCACGNEKAANSVSTSTEASVSVETEASVSETSVEEAAEEKEEGSDFFAIRPITDVSDEMPDGIYSPDSADTSITEDLKNWREKGYTVYTDAETWPSLDRDYYKKTFPYSMIEASQISKEGKSFKETVETAGYKMKEMFAKEALYEGHENEACSYAFSPDEKRACIMYYDAKEKSVNVMIFKHIARKEAKDGTITDYYLQTVTGTSTEGLDADTFYNELATLGIRFDGEIPVSDEMEVIPGGARGIKKVSKFRIDGTGKEYSATELILHNNHGQAWLNWDFEDNGFYDPNKTDFIDGNGLGTDNFTIEDDKWHAFVNNNVSNISIKEEIDYLSYDNTYYASLEEYLSAYKELFIYQGKDARNYFKYMLSDSGKNAVSIMDTSYAENNKIVEVTIYQQIGTCVRKSGDTIPVYRMITFHKGEDGLADEFYSRLQILGITFEK